MTAGSIRAARVRTAQFYDSWSERFFADFGTTLQAGLLKPSDDGTENADVSACLLAERAGVVDGEQILDAGCGFGGPAAAIAAEYPDCRISGVTVSWPQAAEVERVAAAKGVDGRLVVVHGDYHRLPFPDASFDRALFLESIGYSPDHDLLFDEARRAVRSGGAIYVKDVFAPSEGLTDEQRLLLDRFDETWQLARSPTLSGVESALRRAGCEIERSGELLHVGTASFLAALVEPDPDTLFRLNDLGEHFAMRTADLPLFFGEVLARVP